MVQEGVLSGRASTSCADMIDKAEQGKVADGCPPPRLSGYSDFTRLDLFFAFRLVKRDLD